MKKHLFLIVISILISTVSLAGKTFNGNDTGKVEVIKCSFKLNKPGSSAYKDGFLQLPGVIDYTIDSVGNCVLYAKPVINLVYNVVQTIMTSGYKFSDLSQVELSAVEYESIRKGIDHGKTDLSENLHSKGDIKFAGVTPEQEIVSQRTRNSKHFKTGDNKYIVQLGEALHYTDENGKWQDIDYSILPYSGKNSNCKFSNETNEIKSYFPDNAGSKGCTIQTEDLQLNWWINPSINIQNIKGEKSLLKIQAPDTKTASTDNKIIYTLAQGISDRFTVIKGGIEEDIILSQQNIFNNCEATDQILFTQTIAIPKDYSIYNENNLINTDAVLDYFIIKKSGKETGLCFNPLIVFDSKVTQDEAYKIANWPAEKEMGEELALLANSVIKCKYSIKFTKDGIEISVIVPAEWLKNADRSYPVTIDPAVTIGTGTSTQRQPWGMWFGYERSASLYTSAEIGATNITITGAYWNVATSSTSSCPGTLYFKTQAGSTLTADTWANFISGASPTAVTVGFPTSGSWYGWGSLSYNYTSNNLLVLCETNYSGTGAGSYPYFQYSTTGTYQHEDWFLDNSAPTVNGTQTYDRPNIYLEYTVLGGTPPVNDNCSGATSLTVYGTSCGGATTGTDLYATESTPATSCYGTAEDDVWYSFIATATSHDITVVGSTSFDAVVELLSGPCGSMISLYCADNTNMGGTEVINATGLSIGTTYYVRVYDYYSTVPTTTTTFTICVTTPSTSLSCATYTSPTNGLTGVSTSATLNWGAIAGATSYDVYIGTVSPGVYVTNVATTSYTTTLLGNTTYYWKIVPRNGAGPAVGCTPWSFTTIDAASGCQNANPFCAGAGGITYPASVGLGNAEVGPNYGCLGSTPDPVWYYLKVGATGNITMHITSMDNSSVTHDVDFICWGPFTTYNGGCESGLTGTPHTGTTWPNNTADYTWYTGYNNGNIVDCSFDAAAVEDCHIPNAQAGQYYMLLLTNYADAVTNITFALSLGPGATDCSIVGPLPSSNSPLCVGETLNLTAASISGATYHWSGPNGFISTSQNPSITNVTAVNAGTYSVSVTVGGITSPATTTNVVISPLPTITLGAVSNVCQDATSFNLPYTATTGTPTTYTITPNIAPGFTTVSNKPLTASPISVSIPPAVTSGTFTFNITVENATGCVSTNYPFSVIINPLPTNYSITGGGSYCSGGSGIPIGLSSSQGGVNYQLQIGGVNTGSAIAGTGAAITFGNQTAAGTYTVIATNIATSCTKTMSGIVSVSIDSPPTAGITNISGTTILTCASPTISVTATPAGASTYAWSGGSTLATAANTLSAAGTYTVTVTAANGCTASSNIVITSNTTPPVAPTSATADHTTFCAGAYPTINLSAVGGSGTTLHWSTSCGGADIGTGTPLNIAAPASTTSYYAWWSNACGNSTCQSVTITVNPLPFAPTSATADHTTFCAGAYPTINLSAAGGSGTTLHWSTSCSGADIGTGTPLNIAAPASTTTYYAWWSNACGNSTCQSVTITVNSLPVAPTSATVDHNNFCPSTWPTINLSAIGGSGTTLSWSTSCGGAVIGTGTPLNIASPASTTTYYAWWTNGCGSTTCQSVTINILSTATPPTSVVVDNNNFCAGDYPTITLTASGGSGATMNWYSGSCGGTSLGTGNPKTIAAPATTTTYYAAWSDACGTTTCANVTVNINPLPVAPTSATADFTTFCAGAHPTINLSAVGGSGTTLNWSTSCGGASIGTGTPLNIAAPATTTTYYAYWTTSCGNSSCASVTVTINPLPVAPTSATVDKNNFCPGLFPNITLTAAGGSGSTLNWYTGSCGGTLVGTGTPLIVAAPIVTTTYYAAWSNGCGLSSCASITVNVFPLPVAPTSAIADYTTFCAGAYPTINLSATGGSGTVLNWSTSCGGAIIGTGTPLNIAAPAATTTYYASWTNGCGTSTCASVTVTVNPLPIAGITNNSGTTILTCAVTTISVTGTGGVSYAWSGGATPTTDANTLSAAGTYTVTVTATNGCTASSSITLTQSFTPPIAGITNNSGTTILTCAATTISVTGTGGVSYAWSGGATPTTDANTLSAAGTYTVTVTAANGCTASSSITLTQDASLPTAGITNNTGTTILTCATTSISVTATGGTSYLWSGGATPNNDVNTLNAAGTYTVTVTAANGCTASTSITLTQNITAPTAGITNNSGTTVLNCTTTTISVTGTGGVSYAWSGGATPTTDVNTLNAAGTYTVTVTAANGCTASTSITLTQDITAPTAGITNSTGTTILTCATTSISVTATPAGASDYAWSWGVTPATDVNTLNVAGTYTVTVTAANGCTAASSIVITSNTTPPVTGITNNTGTTILTCAITNINVTATGGTSYAWSGGSTPATNVNTLNAAGTYTVTVTAANGCIAISSITLTQDASLPTAGITNNSGTTILTCAATTISVTGTGGVSYAWSGGATPATAANTLNAAGTYTVTVTAANGCTASTSITLTQDITPPTAGITNNTGTTVLNCTTTTISVTATGGVSYAWSGGATPATAANTLNAAGTYTVTVTAANGCTSSTSITLTQDITAPTAGINNITGTTMLTCAITAINVTASGGISYAWSGGATPATAANTLSTAGTYTVTVTAANGCTAISSITLTQDITPPTPIASSNSPICLGSTLNLGVNPYSSYSWSGPNGFIASSQSPSLANASSLISGVYSVTVTNANGCSASDDVNVSVIQPIPAFAGVDQTICTGQTAYLNASGGLSFSWSPATGLSSTTIPNPLATPATNTTYVVQTTDGDGCTSSDNVVVNVNLNVVAFAGSDVTICSGANTNLTASGGTNYSWSPSSGLSATNISSPIATPLFTTTYVVTVSNSSGCSSTDAVIVTVNPGIIASAGSDVNICSGSSTTLFATGGTSYSWSPNIALNATNIQNPIANPLASITYTVVVTGASGCSATDNVIVTVNPTPTADAGSPVTICNHETAILTATGGSSYQWSNGVLTANNLVTPGTSTTYIVTVSDIAGCFATDNVIVTVLPFTPPIVTSNVPTTFCNVPINVTLDAGSGYSLYQWNDGLATQAINVTTAGSFYVIATAANGCSDTSNIVHVASYPGPTPPVIIADGPISFCEGDEITDTLSTSIPYYTYSWTGGSYTPSIVVTHAGYYWVTVTDSTGCSATSLNPVHVQLVPLPVAYINYNAYGTYVEFYNYSMNDTSYYWTFGDGTTSILENPTHAYPGPGTYPVTFVASNYCGTDSVTIMIQIVSGTGIDENSIVQNLAIYPIPTKDLLDVSFEFSGSNSLDIKLLNTLGQLLYKESAESSLGKYHKVFSLINYPTGIYYLQIQTDQGVVIRKIVVN